MIALMSVGIIASILQFCLSKETLPTQKITPEVLEVLISCAKHHTKKITKFDSSDIKRLEDFCNTSLIPGVEFPLFLFSYNPSYLPWKKGYWTCSQLGFSKGFCSKKMLEWLDKYYHSNKCFQFLYYAEEPGLRSRYQHPETHEKLAKAIKNCPLLITCNHPGLSWTYESVLIPDPYMMDKHTELSSLLDNKQLLPFNERESKFFFSGSVTAPNVPYTRENMKHNPRHGLLEKTKQWTFLKYNVTNFDFLDHHDLTSSDYRDHILSNYSHLKSESINFVEHAKYKYLLSFDGFGAAWSRVPLILATGSVLVLGAVCQQYFYCLMVENETHVTIKQDLSNGEELYKKLERDPKYAEKIAIQGKKFAELFLTKNACDSYLWLVIKEIEKAYQ